MDDIQALVIDLGSGVIKAGFAGDDAPRSVFDAVVGSSRNPALMMGGVTKATYIGDEAQTKRGILSLNYPIEHGIVQDWDALEKLIHYTIYNEMRVAPEEHPFLFSEHAMNPLKNRLKLCQIMFENFAVPGYCTCLSSLLAGYACGTTTANVVDIGDGVMTVTPITRGYVSRRTLRRVNFSGRDLTNYMNRMLVDQGYYLNRTSDFQTVRDIKEQMCYVALDYEAEMQRSQYSTELHKQYELPDGQKLTLNSERFRCPEALFKPSLVGLETPGIHELIYDAIMSCDRDSRWVHWDNVVLSGGSTFFPGFAERLEKELQTLAPEKIKVKIVAAPERKYSTWIGGSIMASLAVMGQTWISKEEYDESGIIKAGFAGDDAPRSVFDAVVGSSRNPALIMGGVKKSTYIGDEAQTKRGILSLNYPIEHGMIQDWDALEKIIHYTIFNQMRVAPEEHPFLFSEHAMNSLKNRTKLCQIMFENFAVPGNFSGISSIMAGYSDDSYGITTSNVVDIGDGVMTVTPINWGHVSRRTLRRVNFSGRDLTNYMNRMLVDQGYYLNRTSDFQTVRDIKEQMCYVALDYEAEMQRSQYSTELHKHYELPDGQRVTLNSERFQCPEALFKPSLVGLETPGIHELIYDAIMSCDRDSRWVHWNNIVLSGGSTFFPGFVERLEKELRALAPEKMKIKVVAPPERKYSTWIGGSILASLSYFQQRWMSKEEYDESGPNFVNRKCYDGY